MLSTDAICHAPCRAILTSLPEVFVGMPCQLQPVVQLLCEEIELCFLEAGRPCPPWRSWSATINRWMSDQYVDVVVPGPQATHAEVASYLDKYTQLSSTVGSSGAASSGQSTNKEWDTLRGSVVHPSNLLQPHNTTQPPEPLSSRHGFDVTTAAAATSQQHDVRSQWRCDTSSTTTITNSNNSSCTNSSNSNSNSTSTSNSTHSTHSTSSSLSKTRHKQSQAPNSAKQPQAPTPSTQLHLNISNRHIHAAVRAAGVTSISGKLQPYDKPEFRLRAAGMDAGPCEVAVSVGCVVGTSPCGGGSPSPPGTPRQLRDALATWSDVSTSTHAGDDVDNCIRLIEDEAVAAKVGCQQAAGGLAVEGDFADDISDYSDEYGVVYCSEPPSAEPSPTTPQGDVQCGSGHDFDVQHSARSLHTGQPQQMQQQLQGTMGHMFTGTLQQLLQKYAVKTETNVDVLHVDQQLADKRCRSLLTQRLQQLKQHGQHMAREHPWAAPGWKKFQQYQIQQQLDTHVLRKIAQQEAEICRFKT